jgi:hypothetical protein
MEMKYDPRSKIWAKYFELPEVVRPNEIPQQMQSSKEKHTEIMCDHFFRFNRVNVWFCWIPQGIFFDAFSLLSAAKGT